MSISRHRGALALALVCGATLCSAIGTHCGSSASSPFWARKHGRAGGAPKGPDAGPVDPQPMPSNLKVAFIGDQGVKQESKDVLKLIKKENADFVVHQGDFDYENDPEKWIAQIDEVLGPDYPYFASIGNHDIIRWHFNGYHQRLKDRFERQGLYQYCAGDVGTNQVCNYKGLLFVLSGIATWGWDHLGYLDKALSLNKAVWSVCSWHKNHRLYQIGGKWTEVGYDAYDLCREHGAIVATGHEHSYSRTFAMSSFENHTVASHHGQDRAHPMKIGREAGAKGEDQSLVFVSGIAGYGIRGWHEELRTRPWWASVGARPNGVLDGALLCTFKLDGQEDLAHCEFKLRNGTVWDQFYMQSTNSPAAAAAAAAGAASSSQQEEFVPAARPRKFYETQVHRDEDDAVWVPTRRHFSCSESTVSPIGDLLAESDKLAAKLAPGSDMRPSIVLRFTDVDLDGGSEVVHARLQLYGLARGHDATPLSIRVAAAPATAELPCKVSEWDDGSLEYGDDYVTRLRLVGADGVLPAAVEWETEDDDWEPNEVWVSPDLKPLVDAVLRHPDWKRGSAILVLVQGVSPDGVDDGSLRSVMSFPRETNGCGAPSLSFELA